jgi:hypothetical protein
MYDLTTVGAGEKAPPPNTLAYQNWNARAAGWRRLPAQQALDLRKALAPWYVVRPYGSLGGVTALAVGEIDGVDVVTGELRAWHPVNLWRYLGGLGLTKRPYTLSTIAVVGLSRPLPEVDVLPHSCEWPTIRVNKLPPFTRAQLRGSVRTLPSGAPGTLLINDNVNNNDGGDNHRGAGNGRPAPRLDRLRPLAADPAAALRILSPELAALTLDEGIAWAVVDGRLCVWTRRWLRGVHRPRLAACAAHVHRLLDEATHADAAPPAPAGNQS